MSRTKKFIYNSVSTGMLQVVTMIVGFITPRIMLNAYGSEINGLVSSITQFISYFNLVEAGLSGAAIYALYKPLAANDHKAINGVVSAAKKFYTQAGYIFVSLTLGLALIYPFYIKTDAVSPISVGLLVLILGVNGALEFFTLSKYRVLLSADQKTYVISLAGIVYIVLNTIIIVVLSNMQVNIVLLRFVALFSIFLRSAILMIYCKKNYTYIDYNETPNKEALNKRWDALYLQILGAVHSGTPIVLITLMLKDLKMVSVYSVYNMVIGGIIGILSIFISGLGASFGDVIAKGEVKILQKAYKEFEFSYYALITIVYSIAFITIMPFINIYTSDITDTNYNLPMVGFLFVLNGLLHDIKTPQGMLVTSAGMYKETRVQTTIQGLIAIIGGAALTPVWGISGILFGSVLSNIYRDIDLMFFVPKHITGTPVFGSFIRICRIIVCAGVSWLPFLFINYTPKNFLTWFIYASCVGLYVLLVVGIINIVFDKKETINVINRLKGMVVKK